MQAVRIYPTPTAWRQAQTSNPQNSSTLRDSVAEILRDVQARGSAAVLEYTERFDGVRPPSLQVDLAVAADALSKVDPHTRDVWVEAMENIERFHTRQRKESELEFFTDGSILGWKVSPIAQAGIYVPGGEAVYPSSVFMNVIPAQIAGVKRIALASPPQKNGLPHGDILAAASLLGVEEIYAMGGAQAIGALAYGCQDIANVHKITGPGNAYVAEAKRQVYGVVGIDSIAGPSEILLLCDQKNLPIPYLVQDLLSQAEHDPQARAMLVTTHASQAQAVAKALEAVIPNLPRKEIIAQSFGGASCIVVVENLAQGIALVNEIAPEHLEILTKDPFGLLGQIEHAGAIFLGPHTPESVGDYFAGPNHTLPTAGGARFSSPLGVGDFTKTSSVLRYSYQRLQQQAKQIQTFAKREGLFAHAEAVRVRVEKT